METVRLTIQIRDHSNMTRVTKHADVPIGDVEQAAFDIAAELSPNFPRPKKSRKANGHADNQTESAGR